MNDVEQDIEQATRTYSKHHIAVLSGGRIMLRRTDCGNYWTELISGECGALIVTGDGPDIIFRQWSSNMGVEGLVRWVASSGLGYLSSKVICGERSSYTGARARADLREHVKECFDEGYEVVEDSVSAGSKEEEAVRELVEDDDGPWDDNQENELRQALSDMHPDSFEWHIGRRPSRNLIEAHAACVRVVELLDVELLGEDPVKVEEAETHVR